MTRSCLQMIHTCIILETVWLPFRYCQVIVQIVFTQKVKTVDLAIEHFSWQALLHWPIWQWFNSLKPRQNGRRFAFDSFKCIFLNENVLIPIKISLNFIPKGPINNIPALVQVMAWRRPGDKPLSEPMTVSLLTHVCVTRPQWFKQDPLYRPATFLIQRPYNEFSRLTL